jgi:hypothetical protein
MASKFVEVNKNGLFAFVELNNHTRDSYSLYIDVRLLTVYSHIYNNNCFLNPQNLFNPINVRQFSVDTEMCDVENASPTVKKTVHVSKLTSVPIDGMCGRICSKQCFPKTQESTFERINFDIKN